MPTLPGTVRPSRFGSRRSEASPGGSPALPAGGSRLWPNRRPPLLLLVVAAAAAVAAALPAVYLVIVCAEDIGHVLEVTTRSRTLALTARSLGLALTVTATAVAIAVPLAWLTSRTDLPARRLWSTLATLPIVIPSYIGAYVFVSALGPRGLLADALAPLGVEQVPSIYGFPGAWLVLSLFTYPLVLISVRSALARLDPSLEEAALSMGRSRAGVFASVIVPALIPAIAASGLLVALYVLSDFGAVSITRFDSFTREIYITKQAGFDRVGAAALGAVLVLVTLALLALYSRARGGLRYHRVNPGTIRPARAIPLGRWKAPALAYCAVVVTLALLIPVGILAYWAISGIGAETDWAQITTNAGHSLLAGGLTALAAAIAAIAIATLGVRFRGPVSTLIERASYAGYALPGIVVALALVYFGTRVALPLYQTLAMLIAALTIHFLPLAVGATGASLLQVSPRVEEAARGLGRSPFGVFRTITVPLVATGIGAGAALVFVHAVKELPATLLLAPIGFDTLATDVWSKTSFGFYEAGAIPALLMLLVAAPTVYLLSDRGAHE